MYRSAVLGVIGVLLLLLAGACADEGADGPGQATPSPTASPTSTTASPGDADLSLGQTCEAERFMIDYPTGWWTNSGDEAPPCRLFHPEEQRVQAESLHYAVRVFIDNVAFDRAPGQNDDEAGPETRSREQTTIEGRRAVVIETRSTGEGLSPEGTLQYAYIIDLDGQIFIIETHSTGDTDYERDKQLIDRMVDTLELSTAPAFQSEAATAEGSGPQVNVNDVDVSTADGYDQVVFQIGGAGTAGWLVEYVDEPRQQGSGRPVELAGDAALHVFIRHTGYPQDTGIDAYERPERIDGTEVIREVVYTSIYEGDTEFFVGVDEQRPFRVFRLDDPARVVLHVRHADAS